MKDNYILIKSGPCFHRIAFDSIFYAAVRNRSPATPSGPLGSLHYGNYRFQICNLAEAV